MKRLGSTLALTLLTLACDLESRDVEPSGGIDIDVSERQWDCEPDGNQVTCTAAIAARDDESGAYACLTGDDEDCPPAEALADIIEDLDVDLESTPWACLLTGQHQRHCIQEFAIEEGEPDAEPPDNAPPPEEPDDRDPGDPGDDTTIPPHCLPDVWEPYFCELATSKYRKHGIDITFPCEIFDANAGFGSTLPGVPGGGNAPPDAPSCHDGEWDMRNQSWLDAVLQGCTNLDDAILVMCQQAANYAPTTGACRATGTW